MPTHDQVVFEQFDPRAQAYLDSAVHAAGPDLRRARQLAQSVAAPDATMLDVGCGAGHLSFALAPAFARVVAVDPSPSMLNTVAAARLRGLPQIEVLQASAAQLPFGNGHFSLVCTRYSAHHWRNVPAALQEMRRVVKPDGHLLIIDLLGDESPLVDTHLQSLELLRDPGHARDYSASQWRRMLREAGLRLIEERQWPVRLEFASWIERMRTPPESVAAIRRLQAGAPREVSEGLAFEPDGSFTPRTGMFWAQ